MDLEQYAYLAQILGVIFVAATLVYLAIQVRHGAGLLRTENRLSLLENDRNVLLAYLENIDLFDKMASDAALTHSEQWRFSVLWIINMRNREHEWSQYRDGLLDKPTWLAYREIIRFTLGSKRRRVWWNSAKRGFSPDFVAMVDEFIGDAPDTDPMDELFGQWEGRMPTPPSTASERA
jgi:hypothetical protein